MIITLTAVFALMGEPQFLENEVLHDPTDRQLEQAFSRLVNELKLVANADSAPHVLVFRSGKLAQVLNV